MLEFESALNKVLESAGIVGIEEVPLDKAMGSLLAEDIKAGFDMPPFNKSAMDGYAVCSSDLKRVSRELRCMGVVKPGRPFKKVIKDGECAKIMTGSPLPEGTDSVVMVEFTKMSKRPGWVKIMRTAKRWENVCFKGEDIKKGSVVLRRGDSIMGPEIAISAALGRRKLEVYRRPRLAVLNTGDEIVEPGKRLTKEKIYNSNGPMLLSLLSLMDIEAEYLGIARDKERRLEELILKGLKSDIFLLSGGVSMGEFDLVPKVLKRCGVKKVFHKVKIKPGKPVFFGTRGNRLVFGVPGNPVSTYLTFLILIKPAIEKMMGRMPYQNINEGVLQEGFRQRYTERKHFVPVKASGEKGRIRILPVKGYHGSADIASLSLANAFMVVESKVSFLKKGSRVKIILWR
ncbi:molybdopterin molybdotransferase MoeA [Omnitrophica bacterium]|nr:molybdopterin molybdotransferase MoeA [Candidatus Omnitrophota bacterium]